MKGKRNVVSSKEEMWLGGQGWEELGRQDGESKKEKGNA